MELLSVDRLSKKFGGLWALYDVSFSVQAGEITGVIGPNGAGKTTLFNCLSGLDYSSGGHILHRGKDICRLAPHRVVKRGIVRTFQTTRVFRRLTVLENVMVGLHLHSRSNLLCDMIKLPVAIGENRREIERSKELLDAVRLTDQADTPADEITLSQARRMELARALATGPELLLLDEPGAGLDDHERDELGLLLRNVHDRGVTLMVIEHDISFVVNLCTRIIVLNY
ncbi:MAG: ABC transporter ATP-binding protein, partial [Deltaproteobacteria bacterium]|nr:ABC transporter ATP-binding protein [Deltaproteobacteria bacterium]